MINLRVCKQLTALAQQYVAKEIDSSPLYKRDLHEINDNLMTVMRYIDRLEMQERRDKEADDAHIQAVYEAEYADK